MGCPGFTVRSCGKAEAFRWKDDLTGGFDVDADGFAVVEVVDVSGAAVVANRYDEIR
jgi:hypothetical protein